MLVRNLVPKKMFARFTMLLVVALFMLHAAGDVQADETRPNVVLMIADDISYDDLGCYGHPTIKTPSIDALAAGGLRFNNAYLTTSSCSPSRCSIITGRYPHNTGAPELHTELPPGQVLFPQLLKDAGYYTVLSGKHHMGKNANPGFSKISKGRGPGKEEDWTEILRDRPKDKPFFCWFASTDAHRDWQLNDDAPVYKADEVVVPPFLVDGIETRKDLASYYHEVSRFDHFVGEVVAELKTQGILDNTVIIVMADNGRPFPRCKTRLYDSGIKTPLVMYCPDKVATAVTDSIISSIDIAPTVLELAGVKIDERIQGKSFANILQDPHAVTRKFAFAEHNWHVYNNHERMVRTGDWLYIRNSRPDQQNLCVEAYAGAAGEELWAQHAGGKLSAAQSNVFWDPCPREELYNVVHDPQQLENLAGRSELDSELSKMQHLLDRWVSETGDTNPANPTPHRDSPPNAAGPDDKSRKKNFKHREMPGESTDAKNINRSGPVS